MLCHQSTSVISDSSFKRKQFPAVRIFSGEICKLVETARVQDSDALVMGMCHCGNDFGLKICRCYATFCNFCSCALTSDEVSFCWQFALAHLVSRCSLHVSSFADRVIYRPKTASRFESPLCILARESSFLILQRNSRSA